MVREAGFQTCRGSAQGWAQGQMTVLGGSWIRTEATIRSAATNMLELLVTRKGSLRQEQSCWLGTGRYNGGRSNAFPCGFHDQAFARWGGVEHIPAGAPGGPQGN